MSFTQPKRFGRIASTVQILIQQLEDPRLNQRFEDPLACDFLLGNPQELPLQSYVQALTQALPPRNKDWYAYKMSERTSQEVVADDLSRWRGVRYAPEDICMTNGAFAGLAVTLNALVEDGDEVIFISPPWFFYEPLILAAGGEPVRVLVDPLTLDLDLAAIEKAITPRTRAILINSPNNPTGLIYAQDRLADLSQLLTRASQRNDRPVYLISDEAYSRIVFEPHRFVSPTQFYPHSFIIYTYGKTLLTPGQRIGFIALPPDLPDKEAILQTIFLSQMVTGYAFPNALLQHALPDLQKLSIDIPHLQRKRDRMVGELVRQGYDLHSPQGTFYLLVRSPIADEMEFMDLLREEHIYCLPGRAAELPGFFRISLTASDEMIERSFAGFAAARQRALEKGVMEKSSS